MVETLNRAAAIRPQPSDPAKVGSQGHTQSSPSSGVGQDFVYRSPQAPDDAARCRDCLHLDQRCDELRHPSSTPAQVGSARQHATPPEQPPCGLKTSRSCPCWVRTGVENWRASTAVAIMTGRKKLRATAHLHPRCGLLKRRGNGFESHVTAAAARRPLSTRQASPRTGLTLPPSWCHRCQARAMFTLTGRAPDVP
jgi:hypothetical protein